ITAIILATIALLPFTLAAPEDNTSNCQIQGVRQRENGVRRCCRRNGGTYRDPRGRTAYCDLSIAREGYFRRCVKRLAFSTTVDCDYDGDD
ncbi:hypothetical protein BX616_007499, partial [Lobosporangium transversale]